MSQKKIAHSETDKIYDSINKLAGALTGARSLSEKLGQVVEELRKITQADGTSIWLKEPDGKTLSCIAGKGHYENMQKGRKDEATYDMEKDEGLTVWIAKSGETINIRSNDELMAHPHWRGKYDYKNYPGRDKPEGRRCESFLGTPLMIGNEIIGVIKADNRRGQARRPGFFSKDEERLFEILAALTAVVIKNDQIQVESTRIEEEEHRKRAEIEARQTIAAVVVHNLDNPATGVRNALKNIEIAIDRKPLPKHTIRRSIQNGLIQVKKILSTRDTFLSFIKPSHKEDFTNVDVYEFLNGLIDEMKLQAPEVIFKFNALVKSKKMKVPVVALRTAVNSLIQNAIEATRGLPERIINLNLRFPETGTNNESNSSSRIKVEIIDNGHGVPPKIVPTLFEAFATTKELGSGLGLFASRKIMRGVNGDITYEQDKKIGTKFTIHFPFIEGEV